jgi:diguanylate cyclase (GGDEF)-like protein
MPTEGTVSLLTARLKEASEAADTELLLQRNQQIKRELEASKQRAAKEMADMEASLEKKKVELKNSIRKAETDSLTELLNRGAYDARLLEAFRRCRRQRESLTLIFFDLDYFKKINDTHGHQYGDEHLIRMAKVLRSSIREDVDYTCRFGGDEFAIILFAGVERAEEKAKQVLDKMDGRVSIGIASLLLTDTVETFAKRTDAALYAAKRRGRGQYVVYSEELEKPDTQNADAKGQPRQS